MTTLAISEARTTLPTLVDRVQQGEEVTITRHGEPVAVLVRPDALRARRRTPATGLEEQWGKVFDDLKHHPVIPRPAAVPPGWADHLTAQIRADRDASR